MFVDVKQKRRDGQPVHPVEVKSQSAYSEVSRQLSIGGSFEYYKQLPSSPETNLKVHHIGKFDGQQSHRNKANRRQVAATHRLNQLKEGLWMETATST